MKVEFTICLLLATIFIYTQSRNLQATLINSGDHNLSIAGNNTNVIAANQNNLFINFDIIQKPNQNFIENSTLTPNAKEINQNKVETSQNNSIIVPSNSNNNNSEIRIENIGNDTPIPPSNFKDSNLIIGNNTSDSIQNIKTENSQPKNLITGNNSSNPEPNNKNNSQIKTMNIQNKTTPTIINLTSPADVSNLTKMNETIKNISTNDSSGSANLGLSVVINIPFTDKTFKLDINDNSLQASISRATPASECDLDEIGLRSGVDDSTPHPLPQINITYDQYSLKYKIGSFDSRDVFREEVFMTNLKKINTHNQLSDRTYDMGLNQFTDLEEKQFQQQYYGLIIPSDILNEPVQYTGDVQPPKIKIDWVCKSSPVSSQGKCGACYIIAALDSIEITMRMYDQKVVPLSIQQLLSCGKNGRDLNGCQGGYFKAAYDYIQSKGIGTGSMYAYDAQAKYQGTTSNCNNTIIKNPTYIKNRAFIRASKQIPHGDCYSLVNQLRFRVIAVAISADGMQFYSQGTYSTGSTVLNHGVTLVGYDPVKGYKIRNSWGPSWGNKGHGYVSNTTGICNYAMYPELTVQSGTPKNCC